LTNVFGRAPFHWAAAAGNYTALYFIYRNYVADERSLEYDEIELDGETESSSNKTFNMPANYDKKNVFVDSNQTTIVSLSK